MAYEYTREFKLKFWDQVDLGDTGQCWNWTGCKTRKGYGQIKIGRFPDRRTLRVHRASYEMQCGPITEGMMVCHSCDNPSCVRPDHLFLGTDQDNTDDKVTKGRQARGRDFSHVTLTEGMVLAIYFDPRTHREIAIDFGVSAATIQRIQSGLRWGWLTQGVTKGGTSGVTCEHSLIS